MTLYYYPVIHWCIFPQYFLNSCLSSETVIILILYLFVYFYVKRVKCQYYTQKNSCTEDYLGKLYSNYAMLRFNNYFSISANLWNFFLHYSNTIWTFRKIWCLQLRSFKAFLLLIVHLWSVWFWIIFPWLLEMVFFLSFFPCNTFAPSLNKFIPLLLYIVSYIASTIYFNNYSFSIVSLYAVHSEFSSLINVKEKWARNLWYSKIYLRGLWKHSKIVNLLRMNDP